MIELKESEIQDKNGTIVKEGDKLSFVYEGDNTVADVIHHKGQFIVVSPNNYPISCRLSDLSKYDKEFEIL